MSQIGFEVHFDSLEFLNNFANRTNSNPQQNQSIASKKVKNRRRKLSFFINIWNFQRKSLGVKIKWNTTPRRLSELNIREKEHRKLFLPNTIKSWKCKKEFYWRKENFYLLFCEATKKKLFSDFHRCELFSTFRLHQEGRKF